MSIPADHPRDVVRIAVIGGGITGLAAAHRLTELLPRAEVVLLEASPRLGGVLDTVRLDGFLVERSADNFLTRPAAAVELCRRVGIGEQLSSTDETRRRAFVVRRRRLVPIPAGFYLMSPRRLRPLLASPLLSLAGKLRLLAEPLVPRRRPAHSAASAADAAQDESVASFARRRLGREVFERLVQPLVAGIYTADPERLSMAATMPEFFAQEREFGSLLRAARYKAERDEPSAHDSPAADASGARYGLFAAPREGMKSLVDALARRLPAAAIHLNTRVDRLRLRTDERWYVEAGADRGEAGIEGSRPAPAGAGQPAAGRPARGRFPWPFDGVVLAVPAPAAARLLATCDAELAAELAAIEYAGCAVVSLGYARGQVSHPLDGFGLVVPRIERRPIIAASFASRKFPGRAPANNVLIRVFVGGALQPELLDQPDDALRQLAIDELCDLLGIAGEPGLVDIARWPRAMPQYHVGHLERVARIEQLTRRRPTLALAGNAYRGVGIPQCIASAEAAAQQIAERCGA